MAIFYILRASFRQLTWIYACFSRSMGRLYHGSIHPYPGWELRDRSGLLAVKNIPKRFSSSTISKILQEQPCASLLCFMFYSHLFIGSLWCGPAWKGNSWQRSRIFPAFWVLKSTLLLLLTVMLGTAFRSLREATSRHRAVNGGIASLKVLKLVVPYDAPTGPGYSSFLSMASIRQGNLLRAISIDHIYRLDILDSNRFSGSCPILLFCRTTTTDILGKPLP